MHPKSRFGTYAWCLIIVGLTLAYGYLVPSIYELGQDQPNRSKFDRMEFIAVVILAVTGLVTWAAWYFTRFFEQPEPKPARKAQFKIRDILIITTVAALIVVVVQIVGQKESWYLLLGVYFFALCAVLIKDWPTRWRGLAFFSCMLSPFVWCICFNKPFGRVAGLASAVFYGSGLFPAELLRVALDNFGRDEVDVAAALFVILMVSVGAFLARRGGKLYWIYTALILLLSFFSSLMLHVLYRV